MRYHNITKRDMKNGQGLRVVLWVSHCEHGCKGCHNSFTANANGGILFDKQAKDELITALSEDVISGVTFSGGDPLSTLNRDEILLLAKEIKTLYPCKNIWCYTGYKWDSVKDIKNIEYIDVLVDGKFECDLSVPKPKWCGSSNQRIIGVNKSLKENKVVLWTE